MRRHARVAAGRVRHQETPGRVWKERERQPAVLGRGTSAQVAAGQDALHPWRQCRWREGPGAGLGGWTAGWEQTSGVGTWRE